MTQRRVQTGYLYHEGVLGKVLQDRPVDRYSSAKEMKEALRRYS